MVRASLNLMRLAAAAVLTCAGYLKLLDLSEFSSAIESYAFVPAAAKTLIVLAVPTLEALILPALCHRLLELPAMLAGLVLTFGFVCFHSLALMHLQPPTCGCFGLLSRYPEARESSTGGLRNSVVLFAVLAVCLLSRRRHGHA